MLIDSHCHLTYEPMVSNISNVMELCQKHSVSKILTIGTNLNTSKKSIEIANDHKNIYCTVGLHPNEIVNEYNNFSNIENLAYSSKKIIGIGETGLDFHYGKENYLIQIEMFEKQINLANKLSKPVVVHTRSADEETLSVLKNYSNTNINFIIHCFTGSVKFCEKLLNLGCYISFSGIITFKNTEEIIQSLKIVPLDKLLIETDSPYLSPVPFRGKKNMPSNVKIVAEKVSSVKNIPFKDIAKHTTDNFYKIFKI